MGSFRDVKNIWDMSKACVCVWVCHVPLVFVAWFCLENGHKYTKKNAMLAGKLIFSNPSLGWNSSTQTTHFWPITSGILCVSLVEWFHGIRCWPGTRALLNLPFEFAHVSILLVYIDTILYIYIYISCLSLKPNIAFPKIPTSVALGWLISQFMLLHVRLQGENMGLREPRWHNSSENKVPTSCIVIGKLILGLCSKKFPLLPG